MPTQHSDAGPASAFVELFTRALAIAGTNTLTVRHTFVRFLDNQGEPCSHCSREPRTVTMQAYYRSCASREDVLVDGCAPCMVALVAADADSDMPVTLETPAPEGS